MNLKEVKEIGITIDIGDKTYRRRKFMPASVRPEHIGVIQHHLDDLLAQLSKEIAKDYHDPKKLNF